VLTSKISGFGDFSRLSSLCDIASLDKEEDQRVLASLKGRTSAVVSRVRW
jgi:hypothetical protein